MAKHVAKREPHLFTSWHLAGLYLLGLLYAAYFVLRYGGFWTENDTAVFSYTTAKMLQAGSVLFRGQYVHGFGYPAWLGSISLLTGLPVWQVNTVVMPFLGMIFMITSAYLTYRTLLHSSRRSMVAVMICLAVPDFTFTVLRGNHEKLNILFMLMAIYALFRGYAAMEDIHRGNTFSIWVVLFYTFVAANAAVNDYFGFTFTIAAAIGLGVLTVLRYRLADSRNALPPRYLNRYAGSVVISLLVVLWIMFFVFPPASRDLLLLKTATAKLMHLFLTLSPSSDPFSAPTQQWRVPFFRGFFAAVRWGIIGLSFAFWLMATALIVIRREAIPFAKLFNYALYSGYAILVAVAVPIDLTGLAAGHNLEVRNFTYFVLFAAPIVAEWLPRVLLTVRMRHNVFNRHVRQIFRKRWAISGFALAIIVLGGSLQVTLDPAISNTWIYYTPSERQAVQYFLATVPQSTLWSGAGPRLTFMAATEDLPRHPWRVTYGSFPIGSLQYFLLSPNVVLNAQLTHGMLPNLSSLDCVYDDGQAQIYESVPTSPFQQ